MVVWVEVRTMLTGAAEDGRYEIANDDEPGWEDAERLIRDGKSGSGVVSVRSGGKAGGKRKRKVGEMTAREVYEKEVGGVGDGGGDDGGGKKGKKGKRRR